MERGENRRASALEELNRHNRLVLLGDPGSGKTTFVNFVAMCLAGETLQHKDANLAVLTAPLPQEDDPRRNRDEKPKPQPWEHGPLLPLRVILRDFAARGLPPVGEKASAKTLWQFIVSELDAWALHEFEKPLAQELLQKGGLLLLDGLDEVPEADQRRTQIKQAVEGFAASFPKCRILVTSRTYAYQRQDWRLNGFSESVLAAFSRGQIRNFVERWYAHIAVLRRMGSDDAQGRAELLKRAIFNSTQLMGLAERPLLLTLMASLHAWRGGTLPEKREELYADAVDLLLDWWESPKAVRNARGELVVRQPSLAEWLKVDRAKVRALLEDLAYQAHARQQETTGTADIPEGDLVSGLMRLSQNPDVNPRQLVDYLSLRAGLLIPRGVGVYTFPHRTFQEYLAACYLTDHDYPEKVAELACADFNRWREVALLAGAKAARGTASAIWSLVDALCYADPTPNRARKPAMGRAPGRAGIGRERQPEQHQ
jgi:predicted NACHT family NTPase